MTIRHMKEDYAPKTFEARVQELKDRGFVGQEKNSVHVNGVKYTSQIFGDNRSKIMAALKIALFAILKFFNKDRFDIHYRENLAAWKNPREIYQILTPFHEKQSTEEGKSLTDKAGGDKGIKSEGVEKAFHAAAEILTPIPQANPSKEQVIPKTVLKSDQDVKKFFGANEDVEKHAAAKPAPDVHGAEGFFSDLPESIPHEKVLPKRDKNPISSDKSSSNSDTDALTLGKSKKKPVPTAAQKHVAGHVVEQAHKHERDVHFFHHVGHHEAKHDTKPLEKHADKAKSLGASHGKKASKVVHDVATVVHVAHPAKEVIEKGSKSSSSSTLSASDSSEIGS